MMCTARRGDGQRHMTHSSKSSSRPHSRSCRTESPRVVLAENPPGVLRTNVKSASHKPNGISCHKHGFKWRLSLYLDALQLYRPSRLVSIAYTRQSPRIIISSPSPPYSTVRIYRTRIAAVMRHVVVYLVTLAHSFHVHPTADSACSKVSSGFEGR